MKVAAIALGFVVVASVLPVTQQAAVVSAQVSLAVHIEALSNVNRASEAMTRAAALAGLTLPSAPAPMPLSLSQALLEMYAQLGVPLTKADRARVQLEAARLPTEVQAAAGAILTTINHCDRQVKLAWSAVAPEDHAWFLEASALADPSEADAERMAAIAALVEMERVAACAKLLLETVEHQLPSIRAGFAQAQVRSSHGIRLMVVTHDGPLVVRSTCSDGGYGYAPWGEDLPGKLVRIGGPEDNCYVPQPDAVAPTGAAILTIDAGGNDRYSIGAGVAVVPVVGTYGATAATIDVGFGSDVYSNGQAVGASGVGILFEEAGDDRYTAGTGQVRASAGVALLADVAGNDAYECSSGCQGFANSQGIALLFDHGGNDTYRSNIGNAQAATANGGVAVFIELGGDDHYVGGSGSQAFASNGGGLALFFDRNGNDRYNLTTSYGRGHTPASPNGIAVFVDSGGSDNYIAGPGGNNGYWGPGYGAAAGTGGAKATYVAGYDCEGLAKCLDQLAKRYGPEEPEGSPIAGSDPPMVDGLNG